MAKTPEKKDFQVSYSNQTENLLTTSYHGYNYVIVFYHYDRNLIKVAPLKQGKEEN